MKPIKVNFKKDGKATSTTINQNIAFVYGLEKGLKMENMDTYYKEVKELLNNFVLNLVERGFNYLDKDFIERELIFAALEMGKQNENKS